MQMSAAVGQTIAILDSTVDKLEASNTKSEEELAKERNDRNAGRDKRLEEQDQLHTARPAEESEFVG